MYPTDKTPTIEQIQEYLKLYYNALLTKSNRKYDSRNEELLDEFEEIFEFLDDLKTIDFQTIIDE